MKLTKWFPADIMPVRPGVYEVNARPGPWYRRWDGKNWFAGNPTIEDAAWSKCALFINTSPWRGLAEPPKGEMK